MKTMEVISDCPYADDTFSGTISDKHPNESLINDLALVSFDNEVSNPYSNKPISKKENS